jgi:hypothetical protein
VGNSLAEMIDHTKKTPPPSWRRRFFLVTGLKEKGSDLMAAGEKKLAQKIEHNQKADPETDTPFDE